MFSPPLAAALQVPFSRIERNEERGSRALAQAVFVHKQGRIADRTLQNQERRASGLNLVIFAIALWNTLFPQ